MDSFIGNCIEPLDNLYLNNSFLKAFIPDGVGKKPICFLKPPKCTKLPFKIKVGMPYLIASLELGADFLIASLISFNMF